MLEERGSRATICSSFTLRLKGICINHNDLPHIEIQPMSSISTTENYYTSK
jgi:hypothetical protein